MARYVCDFSVSKPDDFVKFVTEDFFGKEGFTLQRYKTGEVVWTKGSGWMTAPQFYKVESFGGQVHLEAWMAVFALPGITLGETGITGFWGWAVKSVMRDRVNHLMALLNQELPAPAMSGAASVGQGQPIPVAVHNPEGKATLSLILGIVSIPVLLLPYLGFLASLICGFIAISAGRIGKNSTKRGAAQAGFVLGIVGVSLAGLLFILNLLLTLLNLLMFAA